MNLSNDIMTIREDLRVAANRSGIYRPCISTNMMFVNGGILESIVSTIEREVRWIAPEPLE